jgi:hypothetical protein
MGLWWLLVGLCAFSLWTACIACDLLTMLGKDTKNTFEMASIIGAGELYLPTTGWHESLPSGCVKHKKKSGCCEFGFCKGCPCESPTGVCKSTHGKGTSQVGKRAVDEQGAYPTRVLPDRNTTPVQGAYKERSEDDFAAVLPDANGRPSVAELGAVLAVSFRFNGSGSDQRMAAEGYSAHQRLFLMRTCVLIAYVR